MSNQEILDPRDVRRSPGEILDPRDVRRSVLDGMTAVKDAAQSIFGPGRPNPDTYAPPPPSAPPIPAGPRSGPPIAFAPPKPAPKPPVTTNPGIKREDEFDPPTPPKVSSGDQYAKEGPGGFTRR